MKIKEILAEGTPVNVNALLSRSDRGGTGGPWWAKTGDVNYMGDTKEKTLKYKIYFPNMFNHWYFKSEINGDGNKLIQQAKRMGMDQDDSGQWYYPVYNLNSTTKNELTRAKYYFGDKVVKIKADSESEDIKENLKNPQDNPCWKGHKPVGTKKKNGQTVPNCVPKK